MAETAYPSTPRSLETNGRFSLNNGVIEYDFQTTPGRREVIYSAGTPTQEGFRRVLEKAGVILGAPVVAASNHRAYDIPVSARPLSLEASVISEGPLSFTDADLLYSLGKLSAQIAAVTSQIVGGIFAERAFAITDFVAPDADQLYAAPGLEKLLIEPPEGIPLRDAQMAAFSPSFGDEYDDRRAAYFIEGYNSVGQEAYDTTVPLS